MIASLAAKAFGFVVARRDRAYASGRLGVARLPAPVISVGNLSLGGSGKTPMVMALGEALLRRGVRFDVLTRGYRRPHRDLAVAQSGGEDVDLVGDEPLLLARALGVPVVVHADRFRAGLEAERRFHSQLHLLDDGFQHRQLARHFDLVLVSRHDLADALLPAGRLREPPAALARAQAIAWVGDWDETGAAEQLSRARRALAPFSTAPVFLARKHPRPIPPSQGRPFAFCGLAQPDSFWRTLDQLGIVPAGRRAFRDHHRYRRRDLHWLRAAARAAGADGFVTTAKDATKLVPGWAPTRVISIAMEVPELDNLVALALAATLR